jgi:uncharacterized ubiquitin-like protein YukD
MDGNKMNIDIRELEGLGCYDKLDEALLNYDTVENYIDLVFEKDITTKYKPRQKDYRKVKGKAKATLVIEEDDEEVENLDKPVNLDNPVENLDKPVENLDKPMNLEIADEEEIIIIPKKRKTKKSNPKITVNPLGKKKTMKKLPDNVIIEDDI